MAGLGTLASIVIIACTLIVFVTEYLRKTQQASIDAYLKQEMISRGMSAADIKTVLESSSDAEAARLSNCAQPGRPSWVGEVPHQSRRTPQDSVGTGRLGCVEELGVSKS